MTKKKRPINPLLFYSLIVTTGLHLALVTYLFRHPLFFETSFTQAWTKGMKKEETQTNLASKKKSLFLEQALNQIALIHPYEAPAPHLEHKAIPEENAILLTSSHFSEPPLTQAPLLSKMPSAPLPKQEMPLHEPKNISSNTPLPSSAPSCLFNSVEMKSERALFDASPLPLASQKPDFEPLMQELQTPPTKEILYFPVTFDNYLSLLISLKQEEASPLTLKNEVSSSLNQHPSFLLTSTPLASVEEYLPDGPSLSFSDWSSYFNVDAVLLTPTEKEPYRFALTITPKDDLSAIQMKQNITFLIDRSNSIERHRFAGFKRAVLRSLSSLSPEQDFNICIFDRKATFFSKTHLPATKSNIQRAQNFLATQEFSSSFSATELCTTLSKILPQQTVNPSEAHIAILLTDGNALLSIEKQKKALSEWIKKNHKRFSLYAAAVGRENNLRLLGMLTSQTGGNVLYSPTHAAFPRKLAKLLRDLRSPLAHELVATIHSKDGAKLLSPSPHLPSLFNNRTLTLYGSLKNPTSISLALQGMHASEPIVIQKEITFDTPPAHLPVLEKAWSEHVGWTHFAHFLKSGKKEALKAAEASLDEAEAIETQTRRRRQAR